MNEPSPQSTPLNRWMLAWASAAVVLCVAVALGPLEGIPHVQDEVVYQFQARLLSEGRLWEAERLPRAAFHYDFITNADGRRYGVFPNGWPAVLAVGTLLGVPWLVNPLLQGLTVWLGARLTARLAGPDAGWLAAPVLAFAPALVWQGASRMSHTLCAALATGAALAFSRGPSLRRALLVGACLAGLLLTRPLDGVVVGAVLGVWALVRGEVRPWLPVVGMVVLGVSLVLLQNHLYEGDIAVFPQHAWFARGEPTFPSEVFQFTAGCNSLGFGAEHGCVPTFGSLGHTPAKALRAAGLNAWLTRTAWFGLMPVAVLLVGAMLESRARRLLVLGAATWSGLAGCYALYWYGGACLGPRFHHGAAPMVLGALCAGTVVLLARFRLPRTAGLVLILPLGITLAGSMAELPGHWGVDGRLDGLEAHWSDGPVLMLVAYGPEYLEPAALEHTTDGLIQTYSAVQRRGMWLERRGGEVEYAEYQPELVKATMQRFPDRPIRLLVLTSDAERDRVLDVPRLGVVQQTDLPLPVAPAAVDDGEVVPRR